MAFNQILNEIKKLGMLSKNRPLNTLTLMANFQGKKEYRKKTCYFLDSKPKTLE